MATTTARPMSAEALVYRLVCQALAQDDARTALEQLAAGLYDAASSVHDEWRALRRDDPLWLLLEPRLREHARELRDHAGYVQRVCDATPAPDESYCPSCWCQIGEQRDEQIGGS